MRWKYLLLCYVETQCTCKCEYQLNPLSHKTDQHQISSCKINALLSRLAMRIAHMITKDIQCSP